MLPVGQLIASNVQRHQQVVEKAKLIMNFQTEAIIRYNTPGLGWLHYRRSCQRTRANSSAQARWLQNDM
jgi:hypothetical protein